MSQAVDRASASRKQQERTNESRRALIEAAIEAIADVGIANATLVEIARRAGVSRGLINYHFESKNDLFAQVSQYRYEKNRARYREALSLSQPPAERLDSMLQVFADVNLNEEHIAKLEIVLHARSDADLNARITGLLEQQEITGVAEIKGLFPELDVTDETAAQLIQASMALINGLAVKWITETSQFDRRSTMDLLRKLWRSELGLEQSGHAPGGRAAPRRKD